ncbi:MAG: Tn3 family transposase [Halopseudomonas aestusnigri]
MASLERTAYPRLNHRLSERDLHNYYSLTDEENIFIRNNANGQKGQLTLAVMLKTRQHLQYFPPLTNLPKNIRRFLAGSLKLPETTSIVDEGNLKKSRSRYRQAVRSYLDCGLYSGKGQKLIEPLIVTAAHTMSDPADLINVAIGELSNENIELPAFSTLDRLVARLRQQVHEELYVKITVSLSGHQRIALENLLIVEENESLTGFARMKETPGPPTLTHVRKWVDRLTSLESLIDPNPFLIDISHTKVRQFAAEAHAYSISDIRGITTTKRRHTLLICLLQQVQSSTRDELVDMFLRRMRRTRANAQEALKTLQEKHRKIEEKLIGVLGQVLDHARLDEGNETFGYQVRSVFDDQGGIEALNAELKSVSAYHNDNYLPLLWPIHSNHRSVLLNLLELLPIKSATRNRTIMDALNFVLENRHARRNYFEASIDLGFASYRWREFVTVRVGKEIVLDRRALEVCVLTHVARALEGLDLYVEGSSAYADYRTQLLSGAECEARLQDYCETTGIPPNGVEFVKSLKEELTKLSSKVDNSFPKNSGLSIDQNGVPHLKRLSAKPVPDGFDEFRKAVRDRMPERHLLDILKHVHHWVPYTRHFGPPSGSDPKISNPLLKYLFTVFGYGCNLGPTQTARHSPEAINRHILGRLNSSHINGNKLELSSEDITDEYLQFELPKRWGKGNVAIADGTHIELRENTLSGEKHIRYGSYGGIAYHHISDTYIAMFCNFISCGVWEAVYILDGLLQNKSELNPDTLHADTHGQSEPVFGLAHLLGIKLFPRMRNWNDVIFYRPDKTSKYEHIDSLFRATIDWNLIEQHWPDMMQVVLSIQAGKVLPSMLLKKLNSQNRSNTLYRVFRELGRVMRTLFLLRYISEPEFRHSIRAETTKIEAFHDFMDWIGFGGPVIKSGDPVEQAKQLKYMDLVSNAIMLHNVVDLTNVLTSMAADGYKINKEYLECLSPYMREHILRFGKWMVDMDEKPPSWDLKHLPNAA